MSNIDLQEKIDQRREKINLLKIKELRHTVTKMCFEREPFYFFLSIFKKYKKFQSGSLSQRNGITV